MRVRAYLGECVRVCASVCVYVDARLGRFRTEYLNNIIIHSV